MASLRYDTTRDGRNGHHTNPTPLRHGYTFAEIERLARVATHAPMKARGLDPGDVYEVCWGTIVERLYQASTPPAPARLIYDARNALRTFERVDRRQHGLPRDLDQPQQRGKARPFMRYWDTHAARTPGPEPRTVERLTLAQIWPRLHEVDREALSALAATGSYQAAAELLGLTATTFAERMRQARRRFLRLWHQGETPSTQWRMDRPGRAGQPRPHPDGCRCPICQRDRAATAQLTQAQPEAVSA